MRTIETDLVVSRDGKARVMHLPIDVQQGKYHAVVIIDDSHPSGITTPPRKKVLRFSSYSVGVQDEPLPLRREEMYGDNGR